MLLQVTAKWFSFPHFLQLFPKAGHFVFCLLCVLPQNVHDIFVRLFVFILCCKACTSSTVCPSIVLMCSREISIALHTCKHLSNVRSLSQSNLSLKPVLCVPHTILSLISESCNAPKLQVLANLLKLFFLFHQGLNFLQKKRYLSTVSLILGVQCSSNLAIVSLTVLSAVHTLHISVLQSSLPRLPMR